MFRDGLRKVMSGGKSFKEFAAGLGINLIVINFIKGFTEAKLCAKICQQCGKSSLLEEGKRCEFCGTVATGKEPHAVRADQLYLMVRTGKRLPELTVIGDEVDDSTMNALMAAKKRFNVEELLNKIEDEVTPELVAGIIRELRPDLFSVLVNTPATGQDEQSVPCRECGEQFRFVDPLHLSMQHGMTVKQYQDRYGLDSLGTLQGASGAKWLRSQSILMIQELRELVKDEVTA